MSKQGRWKFASFAVVLLIALIGLPQFSLEAAEGRRNVVLLIGDDTGLDLNCYGNAKVRTRTIKSNTSTSESA